MNVPDQLGEPILWQPVQPHLTNCLDITSITFDISAERTTQDAHTEIDYAYLAERRGGNQMWQRVTIVIAAGQARGHIIQTGITFSNVILFDFQECDFGDSQIDRRMSAAGPVLYNKEPLRSVGVFYVERSLSTYGAFCLWECDKSPIIAELAQRFWNPAVADDLRQPFLRHFRLSCDDLGTIHVVCAHLDITARFQ